MRMSLWKRGSWFWADFSINGVRYRVPLKDTKGRRISADDQHVEMAARAEEREIGKAGRGELSLQKRSLGRLPLNKAADEYLASRRGELALSSLIKETCLMARLKEYFGVTRLSGIRAEHVLAYRDWRIRGGVGPATVNMETSCLRRILKWAKLWHLVGVDIKPLKEPSSIGRALTFEERTRLFKIASEKPEWETAYFAAVLAVNTTARKCELRALQWRHVNFINRTLEIPKSKTEAGLRVIPLNTESYEALWKLFRRAENFGTVESTHWIFASLRPKFRFHGRNRLDRVEWKFDPTRPVGSWRSAWRRLTRAIRCPACGRVQNIGKSCGNGECAADIRDVKSSLQGLRFHDLRHTAISALGEAGVPDRVIMDIAGHVSQRMLRRYSHIQLEAKRVAIQSLSNRPQNRAYDTVDVTKHVTKHGEKVPLPAQMIEKDGRPVRT